MVFHGHLQLKPINMEIITKAISNMASSNVVGPSGIATGMLKHNGKAALVDVRDLIDEMISEVYIPNNWQESFIRNVYRRPNGNYRGLKWSKQVMMACGGGSHQAKSRNRRDAVRIHVGLGTTDAILLYVSYMECTWLLTSYMTFVDLEKASDHVPRGFI